MGKKRSNKKKKSCIENVSKNSNDENNAESSVFNSTSKEKNNKHEKNSYLKSQNKVSRQSQSIETVSCENSFRKSYKPNVSVASHNTGVNKSSKKCKLPSIKQNSEKNLSETLAVKPATLAPHQKKDSVLKNAYPVFSHSCFPSDSEEEQYNYSIKEDSSVRSKLSCQREAPKLLAKDFNDKSYLTDFLGDDCYESDKDVANDFFQPVFNKYQNCTNSKKDSRRNLRGVNLEKSNADDNHHISSLEAFSWSDTGLYRDKSDDFEDTENRLEVWSPLSSYSPVDFSETCYYDQKIELKENIYCHVDAYKNSKKAFDKVYRTWMPVRRDTLKKLKDLLSEVHEDQLNYNKLQLACREVGCFARCTKNNDNQVVSFLGSFSSFLSDAACGGVSFAQAFNIDSYQIKFKEIMDKDAKVTKRLYTERSNCLMKYQGIEEVMRKFHPDSFSSTVCKISNTLEINKYWKAMTEAYGRDDMPQLLSIVSKFFNNALQPTNLKEVKDSVLGYVSDNPKALEACKSATQATYEYLDTWTLNQSPLPGLKQASAVANAFLITQDRLEIHRLSNAISNDLPQSKLESQIEDAIDSLESEMKEINHTFYELFKIYVESNGDEWEISEIH